MSTGTCGPERCGDCTLACAGGRPRRAAPSQLSVVAASGVVTAVLAGVLAVGAPVWVVALAGVTVAAGVGLAGAALAARTRRAGGALVPVTVRGLPYVTAALLVTVLARAGTAVIT